MGLLAMLSMLGAAFACQGPLRSELRQPVHIHGHSLPRSLGWERLEQFDRYSKVALNRFRASLEIQPSNLSDGFRLSGACHRQKG